MLDDREPKTRAARIARTAAVDPVKTLGQSRNIRGRDTEPAVRYGERRVAAMRMPIDVNRTRIRRVADCIRHEVAKRAKYLRLDARDRQPFVDVERDAMMAA